METIGCIASIIAAIMAIATLWFSIRNSKKNIIRRIENKERAIHEIENQQIRIYGINGRGPTPLTKLDTRKAILEEDIAELKKLL